MQENGSSAQAGLHQAVTWLLAATPVGLLTDVDGTLSPIASTPAEAYVPASVRAALKKLLDSRYFKVIAVVSGRPALEASQMVGLPDLLYLGNPGLEILQPASEMAVPLEAVRHYQPIIATVLETLRTRLFQEEIEAQPASEISPGAAMAEESWQSNLLFENKGVTASIHYRLCPDPELARRRILQELEEGGLTRDLKISEGRMVIELRPPVPLNKGTALAGLVDLFGLKSMFYLGDDLTDVDAFRALAILAGKAPPPGPGSNSNLGPVAGFQGLAIGVANREMNPEVAETADFLVNGVQGVEDFLVWLGAFVNKELEESHNASTE